MVFILSTILGMSAICMFCAILGQSSVEQMKWFVYEELYLQSKHLLTNYRYMYFTMYNIQCVCHC